MVFGHFLCECVRACVRACVIEFLIFQKFWEGKEKEEKIEKNEYVSGVEAS